MEKVVRVGYHAAVSALGVSALALAGAVVVGYRLEESIRERLESRSTSRAETPDDHELDLRNTRPLVNEGVSTALILGSSVGTPGPSE
jgi:hypothetical protein